MALRVYTKTGDKGTTALIGGTRVGKDDLRIEAYGDVDELNSFLGLLADSIQDEELRPWLLKIQLELFDAGSALATDPHKEQRMKLPEFTEDKITDLEQKIDKMEEQTPKIRHFILPGGHPAASMAHVCRSVCRRAERSCIRLQNNGEPTPELVIKYLNRLSDFFFVLSRLIVHRNGGQEVEWRPNG